MPARRHNRLPLRFETQVTIEIRNLRRTGAVVATLTILFWLRLRMIVFLARIVVGTSLRTCIRFHVTVAYDIIVTEVIEILGLCEMEDHMGLGQNDTHPCTAALQ